MGFRVVGGGIAGAAAAGCLARLPNVQLKVYERSDAVREVGALIGVMVSGTPGWFHLLPLLYELYISIFLLTARGRKVLNIWRCDWLLTNPSRLSGMRTLARMLSPANFEELQRVCYRGENVDGINHRHWRTGEVLTTAISPHSPRHLQEGRTSRVTLHKILMNEVPGGLFNYEKLVVRVEKRGREDDGAVEMRLHFADGSIEGADIVVAADGIYSVGISCPLLNLLRILEV